MATFIRHGAHRMAGRGGIAHSAEVDNTIVTNPAVIGWLESRQCAMLALLERLVNSDSPSRDRIEVDMTGLLLKQFFTDYQIAVTVKPHPEYGEAIYASIPQPAAADQRPILLLGHRDTVFPVGEAARRPFRVKDGRAYGPGIADMKSGLVINAFVLAAFHAVGGHPGPLAALITADEEIASPSSRPLIELAAREARVVLNGEPGQVSGNVVNGRKGCVFIQFSIAGRAAHSGCNSSGGNPAIGELAHKIVALHALTNAGRGVSVSVGVVSGSRTVSTAAPNASGEIDLRYVHPADRAQALQQIGAVMERSVVAGCEASWKIAGEFLPMEMTPQSRGLLEFYRAVSARQGIEVAAEFTGRCADSGFAAAQGTPTLCGLGAIGGKLHTAEEYIELPSLLARAKAVAELVARLGEAGL